jgi:argininosuccinate synthase
MKIPVSCCWQSRGVYETPGGTILHAAHTELETFCLDREVLRLKTFLRDKMADYVYNGNDIKLKLVTSVIEVQFQKISWQTVPWL